MRKNERAGRACRKRHGVVCLFIARSSGGFAAFTPPYVISVPKRQSRIHRAASSEGNRIGPSEAMGEQATSLPSRREARKGNLGLRPSGRLEACTTIA